MLSFADAVGNLFNRLGRLGKLCSVMDSYQQSQLYNLTNIPNGATAQYDSESDLQGLIGTGYIPALNAAGSIGQLASQVANATLNRMIFRDAPQPNQTLQQQNIPASLQQLIFQMEQAGATVLAAVVAATPTTFQSNSATGNGVVVSSTKRASDGRVEENSFAETIYLTCSADSYTGGAQAGNERFVIAGEAVETNFFAFDWPLGSGNQVNTSAVDGSSDASNGNYLTNSGFDAWSGTAPLLTLDDWTFSAGESLCSKETGITYDGDASLKVTGDGSTLLSMYQAFESPSLSLSSLTQYAWNFWIRGDVTPAATGELAIELIDSVSGAVLSDFAGVPNQTLVNLTGLNTVFTAYNGVFRTPNVLGTTPAIRIRMTNGNPLESGKNIYLDRMGFGLMLPAYVGGPSAIVFSGSVPFIRQDFATLVVTNARGGGGTLDTWQTLFYRLFSQVIPANDILLPSSSTPTISDSLITR